MQSLSPNMPGLAGRLTPAWMLCLLLFAALILRAYHLDFRGLWTDEFKTLAAARMSIPELIAERLEHGHVPLYFLAVKATRSLLGESEIALRIPGLLASVLATLLIFLHGRQVGGNSFGLLAALFFAVHERSVWAAQEARPYAFVHLAAVASMMLFVRAWSQPGWRGWGAYSSIALCGICLHGSFLFIPLAQLVAVLWSWVRHRRLNRGALCSLSIVAVAAALIFGLLAAKQQNDGFFEARRGIEWKVAADGLVEVFLGEYDLAFGSGFRYAGLTFIAFILWRILRHGGGPPADSPGPRPPIRVLWIASAMSAWVGIIVVCLVYRDILQGLRYFTVGVPAGAMLVANAIHSFRKPILRRALAASLAIVQLVISLGWLNHKGDEIREAIIHLNGRRAADEVVFLIAGDPKLIGDYYNLDAVPIPPESLNGDADELCELMQRELNTASGCWIVSYKKKADKVLDCLDSIAPNHHPAESKLEMGEADIWHFRLDTQ